MGLFVRLGLICSILRRGVLGFRRFIRLFGHQFKARKRFPHTTYEMFLFFFSFVFLV